MITGNPNVRSKKFQNWITQWAAFSRPFLIVTAIVALSLSSAPAQQAHAANLTFNAIADAQISTSGASTPNGSDVKMTACGFGTPVCSADNVNEKRGLAKFDVSGVQTAVASAKLRFYVSNGPVPVFQIKQITDTSWSETSATWNNAANLPTTAAVYTNPTGSTAGWYEADVTGAVASNGTYSFMFINPTSTPSRIATKESSNVPQLIITTVDETPPPPPTGAMNTYFGTTHAHTGAFNDHGLDASTPSDVFAAAKSSGFNFVVLTEHSGPTGPTDGVGFYADAQAQAAAYSEDNAFIGLAGYEYSENGSDGDSDSGHMTGWGTQEWVNAAAPGIDFNAFYNLLAANQNAPRPVFAGFNHPPATGHTASVPSLLTPERREIVVMSETSNKTSYNATEEARYYTGFVAELDRGWRVAPTCGLDSHSIAALVPAETSTKKPCRTGLLAETLTRETFIDALKQRRIFSTRDTNMRVSYKANDFWMGSKIGVPSQVVFDINVTDPDTGTAADKIKKVEVVGSGGVVLASQAFDAHSISWQPTVAVNANKYMFVRVFNGERSAHTAITAPIWFE